MHALSHAEVWTSSRLIQSGITRKLVRAVFYSVNELPNLLIIFDYTGLVYTSSCICTGVLVQPLVSVKIGARQHNFLQHIELPAQIVRRLFSYLKLVSGYDSTTHGAWLCTPRGLYDAAATLFIVVQRGSRRRFILPTWYVRIIPPYLRRIMYL